ncbi:chorismate synthase [Candidatus Termititenax persephonae]|uniref:Chorismate synthase n=1 Tax=Candidatus Termititenax persephonae TaxID=2218525 RepID=A0A388THA9_9BACT|nr:chorismate synthase [Candidatus Termititenax persephonae]
MLKLLTSGESHGPGLTAVLDGLPAGVKIEKKIIDAELARRQQGYGRGGRQKIEKDEVKILSGIRRGLSLGSPITLFVENKDYANWLDSMSAEVAAAPTPPVTKLRPGHADYAGVVKYGFDDLRNVLERSSARTTAAQVAAGSVCKQFLKNFPITITSQVLLVGGTKNRAADGALAAAARKRIDEARARGDSLGGVVELTVRGAPTGLGTYAQADRRLDGRLAGALMSLQAVKGVEIGLGFAAANLPGSQVQDEIFYRQGQVIRRTNNAGGIEGGISNGEDIIVRLAFKPIPTLMRPLRTIDWKTKRPDKALVERSDTCAIEAGAVIAENIAAFVLTDVFLEKFGGDSLAEIKSRWQKTSVRRRR